MSGDTIYHYGRQQGKSQTFRDAIEKAKKAIQDVRENGWMKPWSIWVDGKRIQVVTPEDCEKHQKLRGRKK